MKTANKIISLTTTFVITALFSFFNFLFADKVGNFLKYFDKIAREDGAIFDYAKMHIAVFILSAFLLFIAVVTFLFNVFYDIKIKKLLQIIFFYINIALIITIVILLLIVFLNYYSIFDFFSLNETINEEAKVEFMFFTDLFILLFLQSVGNIVLSILSLKYTNETDDKNETSKEDNEDDEKNNDNISPKKALILKEIEEMKAQLELQELKNEYMDLYKKVNKEKEK